MERAEFKEHTTKLYSNCLVVSFRQNMALLPIGYRSIIRHIFIHEGDRIKNVVGNIYTVTGLTDKGILTKCNGTKPAETGEADLIYFFKMGFWTITEETKRRNAGIGEVGNDTETAAIMESEAIQVNEAV